MIIKASKILIFAIYFFVSIVGVLFLNLVFTNFEILLERIHQSLIFSLGLTVIMLFFSKYDIEITEDEKMIGGSNYIGKQHFISKVTLDIERSKNEA